jgi:enamine deaminase RidA (YjgF/YER057c/UK114 family)
MAAHYPNRRGFSQAAAHEALGARSRENVEMDDPPLAQVPYDYAAVAPAGAMLFMAGACPLDADGKVVAAGDHRAQAEQALDNLFAVMEQHDTGARQLVKTTIYVVGDHQDLIAVWEVVAARLAPYRPPSTLLGVTVLGYTDQLVEIEGVASLSRS